MTFPESTPIEAAPDIESVGCEKCGQQHDPRKCTGHRKNPLRPCSNWPVRGIKVCTAHGGGSRHSKEAGRRKLGIAAVGKAAGVYGVPRVVDPATGLIEEFWRTAGIVARLEPVIAKLSAEELTFGTAEVAETSGVPEWSNDADTGDEEQRAKAKELTPSERRTVKRAAPSIWLKIFNEERDRLSRLGIEIMRLGLEQQRDAYVREQASVFTDLLAQLNLSDEQRREAVRLLRALDRQVTAS